MRRPDTEDGRRMTEDPITAEEYFRGTLKVIAHWSEVDLSGEWETGLRGVIRSITDAAKEVLSAHPEGKSVSRCVTDLPQRSGEPAYVADPDKTFDLLSRLRTYLSSMRLQPKLVHEIDMALALPRPNQS